VTLGLPGLRLGVSLRLLDRRIEILLQLRLACAQVAQRKLKLAGVAALRLVAVQLTTRCCSPGLVAQGSSNFVARLESWLEAAVTATSIGDVFRDG